MTEEAEGKLSLGVIDKMSMKDLKIELTRRNINQNGNKAALKFRLMSAVCEENPEEAKSDDEEYSEKSITSDENDDNKENEDEAEAEEREQSASFSNRFTQKLTFKDVEDAIDKFSGNKGESIKKWVRSVEEMAAIAGWSDKELLIFGRKLLIGAAKKYVQSQKDMTTWKKLKANLTAEFAYSINTRDVHDQLRNRKKQAEESYREYIYDMMNISSQIDLETEVLISYIIDGIQDSSVDKLILRGATTITELKRKFDEYEKLKTCSKVNVQLGKSSVTKRQSVTGDKPKPSRCYNCGNAGHGAKACPHNIKGPKCFKCQLYGHISKDCKKYEVREVIKRISPSEKLVNVKIGDIELKALVDTGSAVNLITKDAINLEKIPDKEKTYRTFQGLGGTIIKPIMKLTKVKIDTGNESYTTAFYVIDSRLLNVPMLLGAEFLEQAEVFTSMSPDTIQVKKYNKEKKQPEKTPIKQNDEEIEKLMSISYKEDCDIDVNPRYEAEVTSLISNYRPKENTMTPIEMKIVLTDETPIYQRPRRLAPLDKTILDEQVKQWLKDGIITESVSEFSSPVVIVRKKDGKYRVCIDYRKLNQKVVKDRFPMPLIEEQLSKLSKAKIFSTIDLRNGFFHVPIAIESRKYTSFVTSDNQYEFLKAPFGLCNSPASFGRFINYVFRDLSRNGTVISYVDDLIIPAKSDAEGIERLKSVLQAATENGLLINWEKCQFLKDSVEYLGYIIENGEIRPSTHKIKAVLSFAKPTTTRQIQSFLGLTGYFRKFVPDYARIAKPLTNLLRKDQEFQFGDVESSSFNTLKKLLTSEPILRIYDPEATTEVHTDASKDGLAAVLLQKQSMDQRLHPVYFMSRTTTSAEKCYHSYELEVLAVVAPVKKFRPYLLGIQFKIVTDCEAFQRTVTKKEVPARIARWILLLEEFDYVVEHRTAERMKHVDALSRAPVCILNDTLTELIRSNQGRDEHITAIAKLVKEQGYEDYEIQNGVLTKFVDEKNVIVVPNTMQKEIIRKVHEDGHFGVKKMKEVIKRNYFIPNLTKKVENQIICCIRCILAEKKRGKQEGMLHPIPKGERPIDTYHIDHLGPLTSTGKGYKFLVAVVDAFSKFTWLYPVKSSSAKEAINCLELQSKTFGNPSRIIKGTAFTSKEFVEYCQERNIEHVTITTGVPRGNGQVERGNQIIISVLSKLCGDDRAKWYRHVDRVQRCMNSTFQKSIGLSPYEVLIGTQMRTKNDVNVMEILQKEAVESHNESRDELRKIARENIFKMQEQQRRNYNKRRKKATQYQSGDIVAIKRTQFRVGLKLKNKYLGPYTITNCKGNERYEMRKLGSSEGPYLTSSSADQMKLWKMESSEISKIKLICLEC